MSQVSLNETIIAMSPSGVLVLGPDGGVRKVNKAFKTLFGLSSSCEGRPLLEVIEHPLLLQMAERTLHHETTSARLTQVGQRVVLFRSSALEEGGALVFVEDITSYRRMDRLRRDFISNVSHELRTPIAAILGYAETALTEPGLSQSLRPMLEAIERNGRRIRNVFEDLLKLMQIEARGQDYPVEVVNLRALLAETLVSAADSASVKDQDFRLYCKRDLEYCVNPESLRAIIANLAANACHYTPRGGAITVRVVREKDVVRVEVCDTGVGIRERHQARIFERFFRVDRGRSREDGGVGLGLAMVKHLVKGSGCEISVQSELGVGSTFRVTLPRR